MANGTTTREGAPQRPDAAGLYQRFQQALRQHQAGRLAEAEALYRRILAVSPDHDESLHLLGVIACQVGRPEPAAALIGRAIALRGGIAVYHYNLGLALQQLGRLDAAAEAFERAAALQPGHATAYNNLAVIRLMQGRVEAAVELAERALAAQPDHADALFNLAVALQRQGRFDLSIERLRQGLALRPGYAEGWHNLAVACERLGRLDEAVSNFRQALERQPDYAEAQYGLGVILQRRHRPVEAAEHFARAVARQPANAQFRLALGSALHEAGETAAAMAEYEQAIALRPNYAEAYGNLALILKDRGDLDGAMEALDRSLALKPDQPEAQLNQALIRLRRGDFRAGWPQYEARWGTRQLDPDRRTFGVPRWDGSAGAGRTILLWAEQGLGDTMQFCRYAPLLARRGWRVVLEAPAPLLRLLGSLADVLVRPLGQTEVAFDCHCPLMSLPLLFGTELSTIPADTPYLAADPAEIARWRPRLAGEGPRIGLVWSGNPGTLTPMHVQVDARRSIELARLAPLLAVPGARFISLQKEPREDPVAAGLLDPMAEVGDFADTAAIVAQLDLLIAVDTSVVHLAGALGKPVWLLNRFDTCWRWLEGRTDSPWYPTLRQFRQQAPGDWEGVIEQAAAALAGFVAETGR